VEGGFGRFKSPLDCLRQTIAKEGIVGLYKGATPPALGWVVMDSVQWSALTNIRLMLQDSKGQLSIQDHCLAGFGAGIAVSFVASPIESNFLFLI
jgi:solute carrier family 25 (mitochondrial carnitine/acylcarnitine transporter), member 20/29